MLRAVIAVVVHPRLWSEGIRVLFAFARRGWWRRPPFLPLPDRDLVRWRLVTAYGREDAGLVPEDLVEYLAWRKRLRTTRGT